MEGTSQSIVRALLVFVYMSRGSVIESVGGLDFPVFLRHGVVMLMF